MPVYESQEALNFYLNPIFWGGHMLGHCQDAQQFRHPPVRGNDISQSASRLHAGIAVMAEPLTLETFENGQVFITDEYNPGTIVLFREESLMGSKKDFPDPDEIEALKEQPLPHRSTELPANFGYPKEGDAVTSGDTTFLSGSIWGVVGLAKTIKVMHCVRTTHVNKVGGDEVVFNNTGWDTIYSPIKIGETKHIKLLNSERLERINILKVVAYGITQESRSRQRSPIGGFALGHS